MNANIIRLEEKVKLANHFFYKADRYTGEKFSIHIDDRIKVRTYTAGFTNI